MKLNYKKTALIGLAFMSICTFWQMYDGVIPLILKNTFHIGDTVSGIVMAADNVLAIFLLPIFGAFSDRSNTKIGKRMPFIIIGTALSALLMCALPIIDNAYFSSPSNMLKIGFIISLALLLISMGIYRSPAVALMPDLTEKPLRSKGNAIINLMGAVGGVLTLIITAVLYSTAKTNGLEHINYLPMFAIVAVIMIISVIILFFNINEPKLSAAVKEYEDAHPEENLVETSENGKVVIPHDVRKSLGFLLASIALWFIGYNAITTAFTKYASQEWGMSLGAASLCLTIAVVGAIVSYIPIGILASRIGRKKTIILGTILLSFAFAAGAVYTIFNHSFSPVMYILFLIIGFAWAAINVNSLPMVVEMCSGSDIGKFTGYYYTFSMAAQIITPILSGALLQYVGYWTLFPYGALFVLLSCFTMIFVKHGDNKPVKKESRLEMLDVGD